MVTASNDCRTISILHVRIIVQAWPIPISTTWPARYVWAIEARASGRSAPETRGSIRKVKSILLVFAEECGI